MNKILFCILFLISCSGNFKEDKSIKADSLKAEEKGVSGAQSEIDTLNDFIKEYIRTCSFIDLSFCTEELFQLLQKDSTMKLILIKRINNSTNSELLEKLKVEFFIDQIKESKKYLLLLEIPENLISKSKIDKNDVEKLFNKLNSSDGAEPFEISSDLYALLIIYGNDFIKIVEQSKMQPFFIKWIENIHNYEFVALGSSGLPPQIIERKRSHVLALLSNDTLNETTSITYQKIKEAPIRIID